MILDAIQPGGRLPAADEWLSPVQEAHKMNLKLTMVFLLIGALI
jgi:hypothetical protein